MTDKEMKMTAALRAVLHKKLDEILDSENSNGRWFIAGYIDSYHTRIFNRQRWDRKIAKLERPQREDAKK